MNHDFAESLRNSVLDALAEQRPLSILGSGSKAFYGRASARPTLEVSGHRGILEFEPTELVVTARAGTPLAEIEDLLGRHGQMLGFEPPHFGVGDTLGGTLACGFSGPRRPYAGSARDCVLGCKILNGKGEILSFGGRVMKNVAGFDLSRLMVGALGTLGILLEASLRTLPRPECELTRVLEMSATEALAAMSRWSGESRPLSGLAHVENRIYVRLAGAERAVRSAGSALGGEALAEGESFWCDLRDQRLEFFPSPSTLWRFSLAPAALPSPGDWLYDWGGAQRWLKSDAPPERIFALAESLGGYATRFRGNPVHVFQSLPPGLLALHRKLKRAFDPHGLLNPGHLHEAF
jgi:glycolate oxidase FAD binding subunit